MKSAGLSSTYGKMLRKTTKIVAFANQQEGYFASKEKQKMLRMEAARAELERKKREVAAAALKHETP